MSRQLRFSRARLPVMGAVALAAQAALLASVQAAPAFPNQETVCSFNAAREQQRAASAQNFGTPTVSQMLVNGALVWTAGAANTTPVLKPGDTVTLKGSGFGQGTDIDFSKIMVGNARVLETDLVMYEQKLDIISTANYETGVLRSSWPKDVLAWSDTQVQFRVPPHASKGPLKLQVQKRTGYLNSLIKSGPHNVIDAQVNRVPAPANPNCDVVSTLSEETKAITPIDVAVSNPSFAAMVTLGRQMFWSYDYNIGLAHKMRELDWGKIFAYKTTDPITRQPADPRKLFGAANS